MKVLKFLLKVGLIFGAYWLIFKNENEIVKIIEYAIIIVLISTTGGIRVERT